MTALLEQGSEAGQSFTAIAPFIGQVMQKMEDGRYPMEAVRCLCGADFDDLPLIERDRYHIPHRMVFCNQCGVIRATPRMTPDAYRQFYNDEYRKIYDGWEFREAVQETELRFMKQAQDGVNFKTFLDYFGIHPKSIIEIGCNLGGLLAPFKEEGVDVIGADWCADSIAYGQSMQLPVMLGGMDELIAQGKKADLIVLQDVIEHLLDLRELGKLHQLLNPGGFVYIGTPGLLRRRLNLLWQNAHVTQFFAESLIYVMGQMGFEDLYVDEEITSLWGPRIIENEYQKASSPAGWWKPYVMEHLQGLEKRRAPPVRCINKFTFKEQKDKIAANLATKMPDIRPLVRKYTGEVAIVAGGPSVDQELDKIKGLIGRGVPLMVIDRMYPWAAKHGLTASFVTVLDGSDDVAENFKTVHPSTIHLLGTSIDPKVIPALGTAPAFFYHGINPYMKLHDLWHEHGYQQITVVNTGGSVSLACFALAMTLGFDHLHIFGFDCMIQPDKAYATGIHGESVSRQYFEVEIGEKTYWTCFAFMSFAQQFFAMMEQARGLGMIKGIDIYGTSLINAMATGEAEYKWEWTQPKEDSNGQ